MTLSQHIQAPGAAVRRAMGLLLDMALPPQCFKCTGAVARHGDLCASCWREIDFLGAPQCHACGRPFDFDEGVGVLCGACIRRRPRYRQARAVMIYNDASRDLLLRFKHADRIDAAPVFGRWLVRAGADLLTEAAVIVPVPLHRRRLWLRRYNQAALLAGEMSRQTGVPSDHRMLKRSRATASQGGLNRRQRFHNVRGAFVVDKAAMAQYVGSPVLLVDDVMTTGATSEACARALLAAGASAVDVLTLARVVRPEA